MRHKPILAFSLIELMVAVAIGSLISVGVYRLLRTQVQSAGDQTMISESTRSAQRARATMASDISGAGFDPRYVDLGRSAINPVTSASNDSITVQGDYNMSGTIGDQRSYETPETVTYLYDASSGSVTRNGKVFLPNVLSFSITYYNSGGQTATSVPSGAIASLSAIQQVRLRWTQTGSSKDSVQSELMVNLRNYRGS